MITVPTIGQTGWGTVLNTALEDLDTRLEQAALNVTDYGTVGTPAIQAALNDAPLGGIVYLPPEVLGTLSPIRVPPYVTLRGSHGAGEVQGGAPAPPSGLKPLAAFNGDAVVEVLDQQLGGYSVIASQQRIERLTIYGDEVPDANQVDGIRMTGQIQNAIIRDVAVREVTGAGINTEFNLSAPPGPQAPFCIHMDRVSVMWPKGIGVVLNNATDSNLNDVYVLGGESFGWWIAGSGNSTMTGCRSEWSSGDGYRVTIGSGVLRMIGCSTDRNNDHGINVTSNDDGFLTLTNCSLTRDGKFFGAGGGDKAALNMEDATCRVIAENLVVTPGVDDDGSGAQSPQYGVRMLDSNYLSLVSGLINGVTTAVQDAGGNTTLLRGASLKEATGPATAVVLDPAAFTRTSGGYTAVSADVSIATAGTGLKVAEGSNAKMGTATLAAGTVTVNTTAVTANSRIFLTAQTSGVSGTPGALRISARTAGTSFTILSSSGTDTSVAAWHIVEPA
jgi:hypothetical protein